MTNNQLSITPMTQLLPTLHVLRRSFLPAPRLLLLLFTALLLLAAAELWPPLGGAALLLGALIAALLWLDVRRTPPDAFTVSRYHHRKLPINDDSVVEIRIHNETAVAVTMQVRDEVPVEFRQQQGQVITAVLPPHRATTLTYTVRPTYRGEYQFGSVNLRWRSVWGLFQRQMVVAIPTTAKVYPNLLEIRHYQQLARQGHQLHAGIRLLRHLGESGEFEQLRDYLPDDDYRRIDWKATARYGRPITVEFSPERSQNIILLLDTGQQMRSRPLGAARTTRLDLVLNAALMFSYVAISRRDRVGVLTFNETVQRYLPPRAGMGQFYRLVELLHDVQAEKREVDYGRALRYVQTQQHSRSLVVLLTDPAGPEAAHGLVRQLGAFYPRHLPLCVTLSDPTVVQTAQRSLYSEEAVYQRAVAEQILDERQLWLDQLQQQGVITLDVPAHRLTAAVINKYLELKEAARL